MRTEDLDFPLPEHLIALEPPPERAGSRLLCAYGSERRWAHDRFRALPERLREGDLLVLNDTRVVAARIDARKATGGRVEGLWLEDRGGGRAECMLSGSRLRPGVELLLANGDYRLRLTSRVAPGRWLLEDVDGVGWLRLLAEAGATPLPPYVRSRRALHGLPADSRRDRDRYQTLWARAPGAVAAPTASLHFDAGVLEALAKRGVSTAWLTLHVGAGTFLPVETGTLEEHSMHEEAFEAPPETLADVAAVRERGGRVVAAGTTVCRVLEHLAQESPPGAGASGTGASGRTALFIKPGFEFRWTDVLLTNFHTPRSTLLALVAAFAEHCGADDGLSFVKEVYAEAVKQEYRFFSYGDASLWAP